MLIDELRVAVTAQEHTKIIEPSDDALQLHAIDKKDRERGLVLSHIVQERVLKVLCSFCGHCSSASFFRLFWTLLWAGARRTRYHALTAVRVTDSGARQHILFSGLEKDIGHRRGSQHRYLIMRSEAGNLGNLMKS